MTSHSACYSGFIRSVVVINIPMSKNLSYGDITDGDVLPAEGHN